MLARAKSTDMMMNLPPLIKEKEAISSTTKCVDSRPSAEAIPCAINAASTHGTKAAYYITPTLITSIEKTAAAIGVPNSAEKQALMPHIIIIRVSFSSNLNSFANVLPNAPPT